MNFTANGTAPVTPQTTAPTASKGHIGHIVAATLLGGAVLAVVLSVFVFGGATEPVVAGSVLVGFAAGWAALALASQRRTDQPQPWRGCRPACSGWSASRRSPCDPAQAS